MIKKVVLVALFLLIGNAVLGFDRGVNLLLKHSETLVTIQQPGAVITEAEILNQLEAAINIEKKLATTKKRKKVQELQQLLSSVYADIGYYFAYLGHGQLSCFFYEKAAILEPNNSERLMDYAIELTRQNRYAEAEVVFEQALKINADSTFLIMSYGSLFFQKMEFNKAIAQFDLVMQKEPLSRRANFAYLMKLLSSSHLENKVVLPTRAELEKLDLTVWPGQLISYIAGGTNEGELLSFLKTETSEDAQEKLTETFYYVGELYLVAGNKSRAKTLFESVLNLKIYQYRETEAAKRRLLSFYLE